MGPHISPPKRPIQPLNPSQNTKTTGGKWIRSCMLALCDASRAWFIERQIRVAVLKITYAISSRPIFIIQYLLTIVASKLHSTIWYNHGYLNVRFFRIIQDRLLIHSYNVSKMNDFTRNGLLHQLGKLLNVIDNFSFVRITYTERMILLKYLEI